MKSLKKFLKFKGYESVPLTLTETNHFEIPARINGVQGRFILDTGASNTCVDMDKVEFFKMVSKTSNIKAAGAGATEMETLISNKNRIQIGNWSKKKQKVVVFDLVHVNQALTSHNTLPVDGIIGADILRKGKAVIDYDKQCLYLRTK
ncbi:retropepsin-like aspartic protease [Flagellimonas meridianipacifica]|uniref:Aspartyl protease n=1 Tax=Flagellimonas meridianipacifica TaxID=1080225 RepID=A0A2T0MJB3_9FLAO|nr:retropepsin-like aspartic protease [Allomuricauda pacifica]PRX57645.1 aspartyl protease [Allomuricauda pacifica]